jgi:hypothetical protein
MNLLKVILGVLFLFVLNGACQTTKLIESHYYINLWDRGDTTYVTFEYLNDSVLLSKKYFGKSFNISSILISEVDTFLISDNSWSNFSDKIVIPVYSKDKFDNNQITRKVIYNARLSDSLYYEYIPFKKISLNSEIIYAYDINIVRKSTKAILYNDTRQYFSYKNGIVGWLNTEQEFIHENYLDLFLMSPRK